jgi:hypothetical protein
VVIWYIFPRFGILWQEKSGNPALYLRTGSRKSTSPSRRGSTRRSSRPGRQLIRSLPEWSACTRPGVDSMKPFRPKFTDKKRFLSNLGLQLCSRMAFKHLKIH